MSAAAFTTAADLFGAWRESVLSGKGPELWRVGDGFAPVEIGPGLVTLIGAAPGAGKTALVMQWVVESLRLNPDLRALVCNVEMHPFTLLDRQLARLGGLQADWVRHRKLKGAEERVAAGMAALESVADRLAFHTGRPTLADVARSADEFGARLLVLDYLQRFSVGGDPAQDRRAELDGLIDYIRRMADTGLGVIGVSAVARQKGKSGSNYAGLGLASFRGSSELEYGADSAWTLEPDADDTGGNTINLTGLKNRHGETKTLSLTFDKIRQSFTVAGTGAVDSMRAGGWEVDDDEQF